MNQENNYWRKENPEYIKLECKIRQKEFRIDSGVITNDKTLSQAKRDIKRWRKKLNETNRYL